MWTFDAIGPDVVLHATVKQTERGYPVLWIVRNRAGGVLDSGATTRPSREAALIHLRGVAGAFGLDVADLRTVDPGRQ